MPAGERGKKSYRSRPGWTGHGKPPGRWYDYGDTGWQVQHCGHPTAIRPYLILDPEDHVILHPRTKQGFILLVDAQQYVEQLLQKGGADAAGTDAESPG